MDSKEIADYLWKYEGWDYRAALKEAERRIKKAGKADQRKVGGFLD